MTASASQYVDRCVRRKEIENAIADTEDFFHANEPSVVVPMRIVLNLELTLMAAA